MSGNRAPFLPFPSVFRTGITWTCRIQGGGVPTYDQRFLTKRGATAYANWVGAVISIIYQTVRDSGRDR